MEISKTEFIKEVKNSADYFDAEEVDKEVVDILSILEDFWASYPKKRTEEYFREGCLRGKIQNHRTADESLKFIVKNFIFILKKIQQDNNISITEKQIKLFDILESVLFVMLADIFENIDDKNTIPEHVLAYMLGCYTTQYTKLKND